MKYSLLTLALLATVAKAQDRVPDDEARHAARLLTEAAEKVKPPFKIELDTDKPYAKRKDDKGALLLPAKDLSADVIAKAGNEIVPIGQVWMRHIVPVVGDKLVSSKQLNVLTIKPKDEDITVVMCWAGVRKEKDKLSLVLIGKDSKPLLTLPLENSVEKQELPIEFLVTIDGDERATINVLLAGKYRAKLRVGVQAD
jgi:hypothetical protein